MPAGRPTTYSPELAQEARDYIEGGYKEHDQAFPSVVGLCGVINRSKTTIYRWAEEPEHEFRDIVEKMNETQETVVFNKAMIGEHNSTMAKLLLTKHGYSDKSEQTVGNPDGTPLFGSVEEIDARLARLVSKAQSE